MKDLEIAFLSLVLFLSTVCCSSLGYIIYDKHCRTVSRSTNHYLTPSQRRIHTRDVTYYNDSSSDQDDEKQCELAVLNETTPLKRVKFNK